MSSGTNGSLMTFPYLWKLAKIDFQGFMKRQEDDPQDAKDVFRDKLLTSSQRQSAMFCVLQIWNYDSL